MYKQETKKLIGVLLDLRTQTNEKIKLIVFDYAKNEGLLAASFEDKENFDYKKIIKEEFGLVVWKNL